MDSETIELEDYAGNESYPCVNQKVERIKAVVTIVLTAVFNIANIYGYSVNAEWWINAVLTVISFGCIGYAWYKNQNITTPAMLAQAVLNMLKEKAREPEVDEDEEEQENGA